MELIGTEVEAKSLTRFKKGLGNDMDIKNMQSYHRVSKGILTCVLSPEVQYLLETRLRPNGVGERLLPIVVFLQFPLKYVVLVTFREEILD